MDVGDRDEQIMGMHAEGWSIRAIAREVGLSRSRVHQIIEANADVAAADYDNETDETDTMLALLDAAEVDEDELQGPFRYLGTDATGDRFVDANGTSCTLLNIYRVAHHRGEGYDEGGKFYCGIDHEGWFADAAALAEAGRADPAMNTRL
jgi:hypothetical protein